MHSQVYLPCRSIILYLLFFFFLVLILGHEDVISSLTSTLTVTSLVDGNIHPQHSPLSGSAAFWTHLDLQTFANIRERLQLLGFPSPIKRKKYLLMRGPSHEQLQPSWEGIYQSLTAAAGFPNFPESQALWSQELLQFPPDAQMFTTEDSLQHRKVLALLDTCVAAGGGALSTPCKEALLSLMLVLPGFFLHSQ